MNNDNKSRVINENMTHTSSLRVIFIFILVLSFLTSYFPIILTKGVLNKILLL